MSDQLEPVAGRVPPSDLDAEGAIIAAALLDQEALDVVRSTLTPQHLYADANKRILEAAIAIQDRGQPVDLVSVAAELRTTGRLDQIGGLAYLVQIVDCTPVVANVENYARIIKEKFKQRTMISVCQQIAAEGYGDIGQVSTWLESAEQLVFAAAQNDANEEHAEMLADLMPKVVDELQERRNSGQTIAGTDTGWKHLNELLNGWIAGKQYIIAGRPGQGKSSLALAAGINVAKQGKMVIFISAEMTRNELAVRAMCLLGRVSIERVMAGVISVDELMCLVGAANELAKLPMAISERPAGTLPQIRGDIRRKSSQMRKKFGKDLELGMVIVDYLQILDGQRQKGDSRENEVTGLSKGLMWVAGKTKATVVTLSQLNRECEKRPDKRPILADLKESGGIEQDAYAVIFIYRDEYYNRDSEDKGIAELIVAKHRNGKTGTAKLSFTGDNIEFGNLDTRPDVVKQFDSFGDDLYSPPN